MVTAGLGLAVVRSSEVVGAKASAAMVSDVLGGNSGPTVGCSRSQVGEGHGGGGSAHSNGGVSHDGSGGSNGGYRDGG